MAPDTTYHQQPPVAPRLRPFVECLWIVRTDARGRTAPVERLLPDGCIELIVHLEEPYARLSRDGSHPQPAAFVVGEMTTALLVQPLGRTRTLGIRFRPGGAYPFLGQGLDEFTDLAVPLDDVWGGEGTRLTLRLHDAPDDQTALHAAEVFLLRRLASCRALDPRVPLVVNRVLASGGTARVADLAATAGVGDRQLERLLRATVGLGPKRLSRIIRFQSLLRALAAPGRREWATLALDCGYADQPHLAREVRQISGLSPVDLVRSQGPLASQFTTADRLEALFSSDRG